MAKKSVLTIRLDTADRRRLQKVAASQGRTPSDLLRWLAKTYMERYLGPSK